MLFLHHYFNLLFRAFLDLLGGDDGDRCWKKGERDGGKDLNN